MFPRTTFSMEPIIPIVCRLKCPMVPARGRAPLGSGVPFMLRLSDAQAAALASMMLRSITNMDNSHAPFEHLWRVVLLHFSGFILRIITLVFCVAYTDCPGASRAIRGPPHRGVCVWSPSGCSRAQLHGQLAHPLPAPVGATPMPVSQPAAQIPGYCVRWGCSILRTLVPVAPVPAWV